MRCERHGCVAEKQRLPIATDQQLDGIHGLAYQRRDAKLMSLSGSVEQRTRE